MAASMQVGRSGAYFSDTESTTATLQAGVWWHEADDLVVDKGNVSFVGSQFGPHSRLHGIRLSNSGFGPVTIDRLIVCWRPDEGRMRVVNYWDWGEIEWSGEELSGAVFDLSDTAIAPGKGRLLDLTFDTDMRDVAVSIEFVMSDGSTLVDPLEGIGP